MDFEYGMIDIIVVSNPPPKMIFMCPQTILFDRMERGLLNEKDLPTKLKSNIPLNNSQQESWILAKVVDILKKYISL